MRTGPKVYRPPYASRGRRPPSTSNDRTVGNQMIRAFLAGALLCLLIVPASAQMLHPRCNIDWPCATEQGSLGKRKLINPRKANATRSDRFRNIELGSPMYPPETARSFLKHGATVLPHPVGCPRRLFCGCGAAVEVFGRPIRNLWLAANWLAFPRTSPAPGMVAARRGHVFVIKEVLGGGRVLAYDANSGGRQTRLHVRSLAGFAVVNPHGAS